MRASSRWEEGQQQVYIRELRPTLPAATTAANSVMLTRASVAVGGNAMRARGMCDAVRAFKRFGFIRSCGLCAAAIMEFESNYICVSSEIILN